MICRKKILPSLPKTTSIKQYTLLIISSISVQKELIFLIVLPFNSIKVVKQSFIYFHVAYNNQPKPNYNPVLPWPLILIKEETN